MAVMKKIDKATLFSIFEVGDEEVYRENGVEDLLHNTYILLGMTIKGVENYFIMEQMYQNRYGETFSTVKDSIKLKYFTGLIKYLERIDLSQSDTVLELKYEFGPQAIKYALEEMLEFYQEIEYYEKCAIIFKFYQLFSLK